tara:strand:- start:2199 stop:2552 length:354 start_codon:yes stop_codon:yes gene_type:complete
MELSGKKRIIVPPSTTERYGFKHVEEDTFFVGPQATPVYIPGASSLYSQAQLDEILAWQTEREEEAYKKEQEKIAERANVTADQVREMREALQARVKWEDDRKRARGELPADQGDIL